MRFTRLRLSGFKSFVDPTEFRIESGLTGVVGPNGCGKSNLLEALRWVMGANSAKAMRGEGMDDVIFAGATGRPGRNHAEVTLTVDNADGVAAGAPFAAEPVLEVTRRIDRGAGSTYRINGVEVRARDVQMLFADSSTGPNSPALVRQGQISELIAAKPQNRRRILEEAAGVSGLHGRRHEAQLRVRAAEANLLRLDDLARELERGLGRLRREARAAARYRRLAAEIRDLRGAVSLARWTEAVEAERAARAEAESAQVAAETAGREAAIAATAALASHEALPAPRDEAAAAEAILHRLAIEKDRLDRALETARADVARLTGEIQRIADDAEREARLAEDAEGALERLAEDIARTQAEVAAAPERIPQLEAAARAAEALRAQADSTLEAAAAELAAGQAEARSARAALRAALDRATRVAGAVRQARAERAALSPPADEALVVARAQVAAATQALAQAMAEREAAEQACAEAIREDAAARHAARATEDALGRKLAETRGLARLAASETGRFAPVLESVAAEPGLEAALAAALGDDLNASLDPAAPSFWSGRAAPPPVWPEGVTPLADGVTAPRELEARLAFTGLTTREDAARLRSGLAPGARLVSREGDLWRWDGLTVTAAAARPAQIRLEQKSRLAALEADVAGLRPAAETAKAAHEAAARRLTAAETTARLARERPRAAERTLAAARDTAQRLEREAARREDRAQALDETLGRLEGESGEAQAALEAAQALVAAIRPEADDARRLTDARAAAASARDAAFSARAALDREVATRAGRQRRLEGLRRDQGDWMRRAEAASRRLAVLETERETALLALAAARAAPGDIEARAVGLLDALGVAESRRVRAADALAAAERTRADADRAAKAADARAADTREARASARVRLENALAQREARAEAVIAVSGLEPAVLARRLSEAAIALPSGVAGAETHLAALERDRDALGAVNLLAEDEAAEVSSRLAAMAAERADLAGALGRLRQAIEELNAEGRDRLTSAFAVIDGHFRDLFTTLFQGGAAELRLVESPDPLEAGLEILACPPGKRLTVMSLMSGGEQALTAVALIFAVFLANPAPICVLDEVDAPLDDANVARFCDLLGEMRRRAPTRFLTITHNPLTMSRMDRLYGVTMGERGVSRLVSVDLRQAESLAER